MKTKTCKKCGFIGEKSIYFRTYTGRFCLVCHKQVKKEKYHNNKKPKIKKVILEKQCKLCEFIGDKNLFHGKVCLECYKKSKRKPQTIKSCKICHVSGEDIKWHGKICITCFRKNIWNNPVLRLRSDVSRTIRIYMKKFGSSKNNNSILQHLPYSIRELKDHLEKQFEPWMTWNNWGPFKKNIWNNDDCSTWTWQIDHIIPQSFLPYISMKNDNFKKCWALENLRPLSAKINLLKSDRTM